MKTKFSARLLYLAIFMVSATSTFASDNGNLVILCPPNSTVTAAPWECGVTLDWTQFNWSSTVELVDTIYEPPQGTFLGIGPATLTITGIDINGDTSSCSFTYTVEDAGANTALICQNQIVEVILDENCQREITPQMMLEPPGPYGCPELYLVQVLTQFGGPLGNVVDLSFAGNLWTTRVIYLPTGQTCWGEIKIRTDTLPPSIKCPADTTVLCNVPLIPEYTGSPFASGCFQLEDLDIVFSDQTNNSFCDGDDIAFEVVRTWTAIDSFNNATSCTQHITGVRASVNDVVFPPDFDGNMQPFLVCSDSLGVGVLADTSITGRPTLAGFPLGFYTTPCDFTVTYEDSIEQVCGAHYIIKRKWEVIDLCSSEDRQHTQVIEIVDIEAPVFDVVDTLHISTLGGCSGTIELPPIDFIYDCSPYSVEIWTPWDTIQGDGGPLNVPLTPDTVAALYVVSDACGNNDVGITILDISPGVIASCPPNMTLGYDEYYNNYKSAVDQGDFSVLAPLGMPVLYENCEATLSQDVMVDVDTCGRGSMVRTFTVTTPELSGSCQQEITLVHVSDFVVEFPPDSTFICGPLPLETGEPVIHNADIERIQVSYTQQQFNTVPDACYKIFRTWKVINTCVTGAVADQEVAELPENQLGLPFPACDLDGDGDCDGKTYRDSWTATQQPGFAEANEQFNPDTDPDLNPWDGVLTHVQKYTVIDDEEPIFLTGCSVPEYVIPAPDCEATVTLPTPPIAECSNLTVVPRIKIDGQWHDGPGPHYGLEPGVYEVEYTVLDNCNNTNHCSSTLTVINPAPVAKCKSSLDVELSLNTCEATVFASDVDDGSTDNCLNPLFFSFSPQVGDIALSFEACDVGAEQVTLYVIDKYNQVSSCNATLNIQQPAGGACDCTAGVQGIVKTETGAPVRYAEVTAVSTAVYSETIVTDGTGMFSFEPPPGQNVIVSAAKDINPKNGVTTFDLVLIAKHILQVQLLDSPYKIIAADANGSKTVTTFDLVVLRKLVLDIITELPVPSWKMIPESFVFPDPTNPWSTPIDSVLSFPAISEVFTGQNFIGVKIGDVNNSADPLNLNSHGIDDRIAVDTLQFTAVQKALPGNRYEVSIFPDNAELITIQFPLKYNLGQYQLDSLVPVFYSDDLEFGWYNDEAYEAIRISWFSYKTDAVQHNSEIPIYKLYFSAKGNVSPEAPIVTLTYQDLMPVEIILADQVLASMKLTTEIETGYATHFEVESPYPNPFDQQTRISGQMPGPGEVTLYIYNSSGRTTALKQTFSKDGRFRFSIDRADTPVVGKYFFNIRSPYGNRSGLLIRQ